MHQFKFDAPFVYLVTDRRERNMGDFLAAIVQAVEGGVKMVQLREKNASFDEFCQIGKRVSILLRPLGVPLIINDRIDVAQTIGADGVHVGQSDMSVHEARRVLGSRAIIGLSINTLAEIEATRNLPIDYVAASPLFSSRTKRDCGSPFGLQTVKEVCLRASHPVVGIGGIHEGNIREALRCGLQGVAVVSAILDAPCPKMAAQKLVRALYEI